MHLFSYLKMQLSNLSNQNNLHFFCLSKCDIFRKIEFHSNIVLNVSSFHHL